MTERAISKFKAMANVGFSGFGIALASTLLLTAVGGVIGAAAFHVAQVAAVAGAVFGILPLLVLQFLIVPAQVFIAPDGLLWKTRFRPKFFAWSEIARIEPSYSGVTLVLKAGTKVNILISSRALDAAQKATQTAMLASAQEALAVAEAGVMPDVAVRVARRGRTKEEWLADLRPQEGDFRKAPLRPEELWRIVESPSADNTARAGAATVLAAQASEEDRSRLRVAAEACVEPRLRVVLDKAAAGEDVADHLDAVEDARNERA